MGVVSKFRSVAAEKTAGGRLNSWKEIAAYLDRDPRTVQLWEKNEALPVHRLAHQARSSVYAYPAEIDAWVKQRSRNIAIAGPLAVAPALEETPAHKRILRLSLIFAFVLAVACVFVAVRVWQRAHRPVAGPATLAVLPFESQTSSDDPLAVGLTETIISDLGQSAKLTVVSQSPRLIEQSTLASAAASLHTSLLLRGTVAEVADQVSVTVELINASEDKHLWGKTYTFSSADAMRSEGELAATITREVSEKILGVALRPSSEPKSSDPRAMQAYLEGLYFWNQRDLPNLQRSIASFQKAIAIDPKFAGAYAALSEAYDLMPNHGIRSDEEAFRMAKENAHAALDRDPNSAEAYNALAFATYRQDWDFRNAELYFRKAIQLNPSDAVAHQWYGEFLGDLRRYDESIAELRLAMQLKPLSPMVGSDLADGYLHAGRLPEAETELKRIVEMYPDFAPAHSYLITVYIDMKNFSAAEAEARTYAQISHDQTPETWVRVRQLAAAGDMPQARAEAVKLMKGSNGVPLPPYWRAQVDFLTGQKTAGYEALEQAYQQHTWWLVTMLVDPGFSTVRDEPRFLDVARRVGLPVAPAQPPRDKAAAARLI